MKNFVSLDSLQTLHVHLYRDPSVSNLNLEELSRYLKEKLGDIDVDVREPFIRAPMELLESFAKKLANTKVRDIENPDFFIKPLPVEAEYEERILEEPSRKVTGVFYDGFKLQRCLSDLISNEEDDISHLHVVFTNRLFGTWDENDGRYHARVSVYGFPALISTTGIVEAPAKPKEFYRLKQKYAGLRDTAPVLEELKRKFGGRFVRYDDERLTEIMKGYVMQAVFYHLTFEPFCDDNRCRLFNAHWQEEVLRAQLEEPEFCERHEKAIEEWREKFSG
jgi:hypothetical protein